MKKNLALMLMAVAALSLSACKDKQAKTESTEVSTTADGTKVETKTSSDVKIDDEGNRTGTVKSKTTVDPEGMMNKETIEETHQEVQ
ncbi:MAG TPA: hypothetical protein VIF12_08185 [Micavibrio sp.]